MTGLDALLERATGEGRPVLLDGAVGTALDDLGADTSGPAWSGAAPLDAPDLLGAIHSSYVEAGAEIVTASTFRTTRRAFAAAGRPEGQWRDAAREAVRIAREAAAGRALVVGSIGPLEDCWRPDLTPGGAAAREEHALLAEDLVRAGVDALWLETFGTSREAEAAAAAAADAGRRSGVPFALGLTTRADGRLISGEDLEAAIRPAERLGAGAICLNCVPPSHVDVALPLLLAATDLPVGVWANLGRAEEGQDWEGDAGLDPAEYAEKAEAWHARGARILGGCCGSRPEHVRALAERFLYRDSRG